MILRLGNVGVDDMFCVWSKSISLIANFACVRELFHSTVVPVARFGHLFSTSRGGCAEFAFALRHFPEVLCTSVA